MSEKTTTKTGNHHKTGSVCTNHNDEARDLDPRTEVRCMWTYIDIYNPNPTCLQINISRAYKLSGWDYQYDSTSSNAKPLFRKQKEAQTWASELSFSKHCQVTVEEEALTTRIIQLKVFKAVSKSNRSRKKHPSDRFTVESVFILSN